MNTELKDTKKYLTEQNDICGDRKKVDRLLLSHLGTLTSTAVFPFSLVKEKTLNVSFRIADRVKVVTHLSVWLVYFYVQNNGLGMCLNFLLAS